MVKKLFNSNGQALIEYVYVLMLVTLVVFLMLGALGDNVFNYYSHINSEIPPG